MGDFILCNLYLNNVWGEFQMQRNLIYKIIFDTVSYLLLKLNTIGSYEIKIKFQNLNMWEEQFTMICQQMIFKIILVSGF